MDTRPVFHLVHVVPIVTHETEKVALNAKTEHGVQKMIHAHATTTKNCVNLETHLHCGLKLVP